MKHLKNLMLLGIAAAMFACQTNEKNLASSPAAAPAEQQDLTTATHDATANSSASGADRKVELLEQDDFLSGVREGITSPKSQNNDPSSTRRSREIPGLGLPVQQYSVSATEGGKIIAQKGSYIRIPANAFVDAETGEPVTGDISITVQEAYSKADIIAADLPTQAYDVLLRSGGVVNVQATANGRPLAIAPDNSIYVEFRSEKSTGDMRLWSANRDANGYLDWIEEADAGFPMMLIPTPLLNLERAGRNAEELAMDSIRRGKDVYQKTVHDRLALLLEKPETQTTWIATREFRQRLALLNQYKLVNDFLDFYLSHPQKDLWKVDQMVLNDLHRLRRTNARKFENQKINRAIEAFTDFVAEKRTQPERLPQIASMAADEDIADQYIAAGYSSKDANRYALIREITRDLEQEYAAKLAREQALAEKRDAKNRAGTIFNGLMQRDPQQRGFSLTKLGWFNNDAPVIPRDTQLVQVPILAASQKAVEYTRCYVVYDRVNMVAELRHDGTGIFERRRLENKRKSRIIAVSYADDKYYLAYSDYRIGDPEPSLQLKACTLDEIQQQLAQLN